jgi:hypothetical protein
MITLKLDWEGCIFFSGGVCMLDKEIGEVSRKYCDGCKYRLPLERSTCKDCGMNETCDFAFDRYNTDGDCLWMK